jgi:hypothetical protein
VILETVLQLQREGVANLVDKWDGTGLAATGMDLNRALRFSEEMARSPEILARIDQILMEVAVTADGEFLALIRGGMLIPDLVMVEGALGSSRQASPPR